MTELTYVVQEWLGFALMLAAQLLLVLVLRKPVRAWLGAVACYRLWLLPVLWLPFYVVGPVLFSALARLGGSDARNDAAPTSLERFMQIELLPLDLNDGAQFTAGGSAFPGLSLVATIWACGTLALVAWHGCRWLFFSRSVRTCAMALSADERRHTGAAAHFADDVSVVRLPGMNSAALFGVVKPTLLVPEDFAERYDPNQRHIILAHEAVHLRRGDNAWNLVALLLIALFWMNPLVFVAWRYFRLDQELSCDALALRRCSKEQQKRYARTLVDSLGTRPFSAPQPVLSAWDNLRDLKERSVMIKQHLNSAARPVTAAVCLLTLGLSGAVLTVSMAELLSPPALAAEPAATPAGDDATTTSQNISQSTGRIMSEAIKLLNDDKFSEARAALQPLLEPAQFAQLSPFEQSRVHQLLFNLEMHDEDYPGAREQLQAALDSGGLNAQEASQMSYQLAQLYMQEERYTEAAEALERWIASAAEPNSGAYYLLAASYYYMDQFETALPHAQKAVELAGDEPHEAWLQMLGALHMQLEQYDAAEPVYERLAETYPEKETYRMTLEGLRAQRAQ